MAQSASWTARLGRQFLRITPDPDDIREHAPIAVPFVMVVLAQATSAWSIRGVTAVGLAADRATADAIDWLLLIMMFFSPVLTVVRALTLAAVTWAILVLFSAKARFRPLLSIHMYGTLTLALSGIATAIVLRFRRSAEFTGTEDLLVPMGLDLFVDSGSRSSPAMLAAMQHTSVFHVLWVIVVGWLLRRATSVSGRIALATALVLWGLGMGYAILRIVLFTM